MALLHVIRRSVLLVRLIPSTGEAEAAMEHTSSIISIRHCGYPYSRDASDGFWRSLHVESVSTAGKQAKD